MSSVGRDEGLLLSYDISSQPVASQNATVSLHVKVKNDQLKTVRCNRLLIGIPVGLGEHDLTNIAESISPDVSSGFGAWTAESVADKHQYGIGTEIHKNWPFPSRKGEREFLINVVQINSHPGVVTLDILETSTLNTSGNPTGRVGKFEFLKTGPNDRFQNFRPEPIEKVVVKAGESVKLIWDDAFPDYPYSVNPVQGQKTFNLSLDYDQLSSPKVFESDRVTTDSFPLHHTTMFTLRANLTEADGRTFHKPLYLLIPVSDPDLRLGNLTVDIGASLLKSTYAGQLSLDQTHVTATSGFLMCTARNASGYSQGIQPYILEAVVDSTTRWRIMSDDHHETDHNTQMCIPLGKGQQVKLSQTGSGTYTTTWHSLGNGLATLNPKP